MMIPMVSKGFKRRFSRFLACWSIFIGSL